jgi:hypothetical protein
MLPMSALPLSTTNYTAIIRPLQWLVIALIFLFFLRVVRAVWVEIRPAGPRTTRAERRRQRREQQGLPAPRRHRPLHLEVMEPADQRGRVYEVDGDVMVGRSAGAGISTSQDVYSSTMHARLYRQTDQLWVEDLGSTNGTFVNSERIKQETKLTKGDVLQIGNTIFEVTR